MRMISREDLKQRVMGHFCGSCSTPYKDTDILELGEYCCDMVSDTIAFIDELPTIETEPVKHGRWIKHRIYDPKSILHGAVKDTTCSVCGKSTPYNTEYCQNCGARMDGDSE